MEAIDLKIRMSEKISVRNFHGIKGSYLTLWPHLAMDAGHRYLCVSWISTSWFKRRLFLVPLQHSDRDDSDGWFAHNRLFDYWAPLWQLKTKVKRSNSLISLATCTGCLSRTKEIVFSTLNHNFYRIVLFDVFNILRRAQSCNLPDWIRDANCIIEESSKDNVVVKTWFSFLQDTPSPFKAVLYLTITITQNWTIFRYTAFRHLSFSIKAKTKKIKDKNDLFSAFLEKKDDAQYI